MATNEILRFAETDTGTNLLTQAEYLADSQRPIGNQPGVARSKLVNKAIRQSSLIAAAVAKFIADNQANNVVDTADPANIAVWLETVVRSLGIPTAVAGGTANAITADFTPNVALTNGTTVVVRAGAASTATTPTFAPDGLTAKTIVKGANAPLIAGDIAGAGHWLEMNFDTTLDKWVLQNPYSTLVFASAAEAQDGTNNTNAITPLRMREGFNASGTAPVYACRAWVNFNGTGTVAIRASGNVSSITDNGVGDYTVNFTVAMPSVSYSAVCSCSDGTTAQRTAVPFTFATTSVKVGTRDSATALFDAGVVTAAIFI